MRSDAEPEAAGAGNYREPHAVDEAVHAIIDPVKTRLAAVEALCQQVSLVTVDSLRAKLETLENDVRALSGAVPTAAAQAATPQAATPPAAAPIVETASDDLAARLRGL